MPLIDTTKREVQRPLWCASDLLSRADELCIRLMVGMVSPEEKGEALELVEQVQKRLTEMKRVVQSI